VELRFESTNLAIDGAEEGGKVGELGTADNAGLSFETLNLLFTERGNLPFLELE